jgi:hypothetical protein
MPGRTDKPVKQSHGSGRRYGTKSKLTGARNRKVLFSRPPERKDGSRGNLTRFRDPRQEGHIK